MAGCPKGPASDDVESITEDTTVVDTVAVEVDLLSDTIVVEHLIEELRLIE